jgi:segregation and condensation protein A
MFTAGLELVKQGKADIRQDGAFRPIYLRANYEDRVDGPVPQSSETAISNENEEDEPRNNEAVGV